MNKKIEIGELIQRIVFADVTIASLIALLKEKGVSEDEVSEFVDTFLSKITMEEWGELANNLALDILSAKEKSDA
jgi:anthranilate phosphoribosyltransferase